MWIWVTKNIIFQVMDRPQKMKRATSFQRTDVAIGCNLPRNHARANKAFFRNILFLDREEFRKKPNRMSFMCNPIILLLQDLLEYTRIPNHKVEKCIITGWWFRTKRKKSLRNFSHFPGSPFPAAPLRYSVLTSRGNYTKIIT